MSVVSQALNHPNNTLPKPTSQSSSFSPTTYSAVPLGACQLNGMHPSPLIPYLMPLHRRYQPRRKSAEPIYRYPTDFLLLYPPSCANYGLWSQGARPGISLDYWLERKEQSLSRDSRMLPLRQGNGGPDTAIAVLTPSLLSPFRQPLKQKRYRRFHPMRTL
jgi:hypothetical protein